MHGNRRSDPGTTVLTPTTAGVRVLMDMPHADAPTDPEYDVRAIGAVLYASLTGHWPYAEAGRSALPDAMRDSSGRIVRPRQMRANVPAHLDDIAAELLDPQVEPPPAPALAAEFARLATNGGYEEDYHGDEEYGGTTTARWASPTAVEEPRRRAGGKLALGIAVPAGSSR